MPNGIAPANENQGGESDLAAAEATATRSGRTPDASRKLHAPNQFSTARAAEKQQKKVGIRCVYKQATLRGFEKK